MKKEIRRIDRDIQALEREEKKHVEECKKLAKRDKKAMVRPTLVLLFRA